MEIDTTAAERFLAYADGERPLDDVWNHPAYDIARTHAALLGRDLGREDVEAAMDGEESAFRHVGGLADNRDRIDDLLAHVATTGTDWTDRIERELARITPDADLSELPVYLAIGYQFGIGTRGGAVINLNQPLFFEDPRQLLYTAVHESSHVVYDRHHDYTGRFQAADLTTGDGQRRAFATLFHTEAFATYTPLALRREDGNLGTHDHLVCADYRVLGDDERLGELVAEYDAFRGRLREGPVDRETLFAKVFGESRLPYRVGCAMLDRIERTRGPDAVREAFHVDARTFIEEYDGVLDPYRTGS